MEDPLADVLSQVVMQESAGGDIDEVGCIDVLGYWVLSSQLRRFERQCKISQLRIFREDGDSLMRVTSFETPQGQFVSWLIGVWEHLPQDARALLTQELRSQKKPNH